MNPIFKRALSLLSLLPLFIFVSCSSGVVPMGRDTYMISGSSPGLIGTGTVRAKLLKQADAWCRSQGLVMVPLNYSGSDAVVGGQWANSEVIFRAVPPSDAENIRMRYERGADHHQVIEIRKR